MYADEKNRRSRQKKQTKETEGVVVMAKNPIVMRIVNLVSDAGGTLKLDAKKHKEVIEAVSSTEDAIGTRTRHELATVHGIVVLHKPNTNPPVPDVIRKTGVKAGRDIVKASAEHEYVLPSFTGEVECLLAAGRNWETEKSINIRFVGPMGSGKTEFAIIIGERCGFERVYQLNGRADMTSGDLLGEKVVEVDEKSMQSYIRLQRGILEQAMTCGLEKDDNGNVVYDKDGNVQVIGKPGLLFYDEYASAPAEVNIMLNQITQIPRKPGESRELVLTNDGGRMVKSHPGFCMIFSGNTNGRGLGDESQMVYTAQGVQQDGSFLDRIKPVYPFGFNLKAEKKIMMVKIADDVVQSRLTRFVAAIRALYLKREIETLISTRNVVDICDNMRRFRAMGFEDYEPRAIYRTMGVDLTSIERPSWSETSWMSYSVRFDVFENEDDMWYPNTA